MSTPERVFLIQKSNNLSFITTGLALFSMFFGAGNLIFPLLIGRSVGDNVWFAIIGLGLTAVFIPFLGLAVMVLFQANYYHFFGRIGKIPGMLLLLLLQFILGPFGVIPRLITLMHAMAMPYLHDMSLISFSGLIAVVLFGCSFKRDLLIRFLGIILTPVLILSLAALEVSGLMRASELSPSVFSSKDSFLHGLLGGYNTMDLIAAFLFATVVLPHFQKEMKLDHPEEKRRLIMKKLFFSSLIAAPLLLFTYIGLAFLAAQKKFDFSCPPEQLFSSIARELLGSFGVVIAVVTVITACLTTAMTLVSIFSDYLRKDLCKEKIGPTSALVITIAIATLFATLGFQEIAAFLSPILQIVYPGLIVLTVLNLLNFLYSWKRVKVPVFFVFAVSFIVYLS